MTPSVPWNSRKPCRLRPESNVSRTSDVAPDSWRRSARIVVGTSTSNFVPALGPDMTSRTSRALPPPAVTLTTGPRARTSAVK